MKWYRKAAEQGFAAAQFNLGVSYGTGQGVTQDDKEAMKWFRKAAEHGVAGAQSKLGLMYVITQDYIQAYKWFTLASSQGDEDAAKVRDLVVGEMSSEQIVEAQRLASEWRKQ